MPFVVLVLALALGIAVPFFWASALPVYLGAVLLVLAGLLAKRVVPALLALLAAVALVLAPGLINGYRNGQGIAWTVPDGERLRLAEDGLAVTVAGSVVHGRDLRTGERRWEFRLPEGDGNVRLWRVGDRLLVIGPDDVMRALGVQDGQEQWQGVPLDTQYVGVTDGEHLALTRCSGMEGCEVQSITLATGLVAWREPVTGTANYLGVPLPDRGAPQRDLPPWPASFVLVGDDRRWTARDLATGRVLATGDHRDGTTGMIGDVLVRSPYDGATTATDVHTGEALWSRPPGDGTPSRSPVVSTGSLALPTGRLVLSATGDPIDSVRLGDRLRVVDPRTGEVEEQPIDVDFSLVDVLAPARPSARLPVVFWRDYDDHSLASRIIADGRTYDRESTRDVDVAPQLLGFGSAGRTWGTGLERVYEVFDRESGDRIVRYAGEDVTVHALGDVLVLTEGDDDDAPRRVIAPRVR